MVQRQKAGGGRWAEVAGLIGKNLKAWAKARGLERVRTRRQGSGRITSRWVLPQPAPLAARPQPVAADPARYFAIEIEARPGINHLRFALELLIREAASLGRTPIVFEPRFDPRHNLGHDLVVSWRKYLDLDAIELHNAAAGTTQRIRALQRADVPGLDRLATAWFEREHRITEAENAAHALIVRHNKTGLQIDAVHDGPAGLPGYVVRFAPSAQVLALCAQVQARLGAFCAMHVRRDDMLAMKQQFPNLERDTQPENIAAVLRRHLARGARVYIMTNERDRAFFDPLRSEFEIFQYFDFPELRTLLEGPEPDNFFLFEIEKVLFEHAATRVHTFAHPEGGARISLTTDKGWA